MPPPAPATAPTGTPPQPFRTFLRLWQPLAALSSGGLLTLCFAPWEQQWLCWIALTPLLTALWFGGQGRKAGRVPLPDAPSAPSTPPRRWRRWVGRAGWGVRVITQASWGRGFFLGYMAGLVFFWGAFYWLWEVTPPGWFILSFYMALYFAVWGSFMATVGRPAMTMAAVGGQPPPRGPVTRGRDRSSHTRSLAGTAPLASPFLRSRWNLWYAFLAAACWVALEWVRGWMFSGFGWNDVGVGLHASLPLIQIAEWTGVGGVSFLAVFANVIAVATVRRFFLEVRSHRVRPHFDFTLTIAGLLAVFAFGVHRIQTIDRQNARPGAGVPLRVAAVQADVARADVWSPALAAKIFPLYERLTGAALVYRPQLLLWPECSTVVSMFGYKDVYDFVRATSGKTADANFLLGTLDADFGDDGKASEEYNAAVLLPVGGGDMQIYRKIHLVPFGEYIPFRKSFPLFAWLLEDQVPGDFGFGTVPGLFRLRSPEITAAPLICFEDTLGRLVRTPVQQGAQLLVNITNDVWFGRTGQPIQHLNESVFRCVENRRPLVRCANTGATAFVDATGRVTNILRSSENGSVFTTGVLWGEVKVPAEPALTFYTRNGEVFSVACGVAAMLATFLHIWRKRGRPTGELPTNERDPQMDTHEKSLEPVP